MPNWLDIKKCPIWKELGVTKCNNCNTRMQCWGKDSELPEPSDAGKLLRTYAMLGMTFNQQQRGVTHNAKR